MENELLGQRYKLIEEIGRGGMAVVYKAKCTLLNRFVAVKILKEELSNDPEFLKRFNQEAQAAASLSHQNIVSIFDVGNDGDKYYIVMEYIQGITLKEYIRKKGQLDIEEAMSIGTQVINAIAHAHKNGVVHRDIKPHNILLQKDNTAKVTDFGIARAASNATITMSGNTIGSVHYFSPEQARGTVTDAKSDLYSFATTFYEVLTGKLVFEADTPIAVALKHIQEEPVPPNKINKKIPLKLNNIIMKLLQKDPEDRYENAKQVLQDMNDFSKRYTQNEVVNEEDNTDISNKNSKSENKRPDEYYMMKKTNKRDARDFMTTFVSIVVAIATIALFAYLVFNVVIPSLEEVDNNITEIVIEDYTGKDFNEVASELDEYNIEIEKNEIHDEETASGTILSQNISAGSTLKERGKIKLTVSLGPKYITIKDYTNMDYRKVKSELEELGLTPIIKSEYNDRVANGLVFATDPKNNNKVRLGTEIIIYRSLGKEEMYVIVPNLIGKSFEEALQLLEENNLALGETENYQEEGYSNEIAYQSPASEVEVPEGTEITIFMKKNDEEQDEPVRPDSESEISDDDIIVETEDYDNYVYMDEEISLEGIELEDEFELSIETRTSMEDLFSVKYKDMYNKEELPYILRIEIPIGGSIQINIYVNGKFVKTIERDSTEVN